MKTIRLMEPFRITGEPLLKRNRGKHTPEVSIKKAIAERDRLMKKIRQSTQLKKQTGMEILCV